MLYSYLLSKGQLKRDKPSILIYVSYMQRIHTRGQYNKQINILSRGGFMILKQEGCCPGVVQPIPM